MPRLAKLEGSYEEADRLLYAYFIPFEGGDMPPVDAWNPRVWQAQEDELQKQIAHSVQGQGASQPVHSRKRGREPPGVGGCSSRGEQGAAAGAAGWLAGQQGLGAGGGGGGGGGGLSHTSLQLLQAGSARLTRVVVGVPRWARLGRRTQLVQQQQHPLTQLVQQRQQRPRCWTV